MKKNPAATHFKNIYFPLLWEFCVKRFIALMTEADFLFLRSEELPFGFQPQLN